MASSKQKTTWSKIQRESKRREKRAEKAARKVARKAEAEATPTDEFGNPIDEFGNILPAADAEFEGHEDETPEEAVQGAA